MSSAKNSRATTGKSKGKKPADKKEQSSLVTTEYKRLKELSRFGKTDLTSSEQSHVKLSNVPKFLRKCNEVDIVQPKSGKARYLLQFPAAFTASDLSHRATIGRLAKLDTYTPVLYLDFGEHGQAKFQGYRQYIKSNIVAFECKSSGLNVIQQFDHLIVFTELVWVGTTEENPKEVPLPFPKSIVARSRITQGMDGDTTSTLKIVSSSRSTPSSSAKGKPHAPRLDPDGSPASNIDSPPDSTPASARARSSSRSSKAISYEIRGSSDEGKSETDEDDGRPKNTTPSVRRPSSKKTKNSPPVLEIFDDGDEDDNDDNDVQLLSATNTLKSKAAQKKPTPRKKGATKQASIASTEDVDSDDAFDPGESVATTSTFSSASRRPGRSTRKAITYTENDSEDNDDEEEDDSSHGADSDDDLSSTKRTILSGSSSSKRNVVDRQAAPKSTAGSSVSADSGSKKAWSPQIKKRKNKAGSHTASAPASLLLFDDDDTSADVSKKRKTTPKPKRTLEAFGFK